MRPEENMPHLDEGTAHAWLDGALDATQSAGVEAHLASCTECAERVAEARGFVAGASRILGALDDVPANVVPNGLPNAAPNATPNATPNGVLRADARRRPVRRVPGWMRGAAAATVLVAAGSAVVLARRPSGAADAIATTSAPEADTMTSVPSAPLVPPAAPPTQSPMVAAAPPAPRARGAMQSRVAEAAPARSSGAASDAASGAARDVAPNGLAAAVPTPAPANAPFVERRMAKSAEAPAAAGNAFATGVVSGKVTDARGTPLRETMVRIAGSPAVTLSDSTGHFVLHDVPVGATTVRAQRLGFAPSTASVPVVAAETTSASLVLRPSALQLQQTVVTGTAQPPSHRAIRLPDILGCWLVHAEAWTPPLAPGVTPLPARIQLGDEPHDGVRWTADGDTTRVTLGTAELRLRVEKGVWRGTATSNGHTAPVWLERASGCQ